MTFLETNDCHLLNNFIHLSDDFSPHLYYSNEHTNISSSSPDFSLHLQCRLSGSVMSSSKDTQRSQRRRSWTPAGVSLACGWARVCRAGVSSKRKLGFSLHSELAQHLLERYNTVILFCREIQLPLDPQDDSSLDAHSRFCWIASAVVDSGFEDDIFFQLFWSSSKSSGKDRNYEWA